MNFDYLKLDAELEALYSACHEAEEFALGKPAISAVSARRAMEFIVKYIYAQVEPHPPYGVTVYDMIRDPRFQELVGSAQMLEDMDFIRSSGNSAAHGGSLDAERAMNCLERLHHLVGEFAVGICLIEAYAAFERPLPNRIRDAMGKLHPDNFDLKLAPWLRLAGHESWADALEAAKVFRFSELYDLPRELNRDEFFEFLKPFELPKREETQALLDAMDVSPAPESVWKQRRAQLDEKVVARIECYVESAREGNHTPWGYYTHALGGRAAGYGMLTHPECLRETVAAGFILPEREAPESEENLRFIPLKEVVKALIRCLAAESERKLELISKAAWCQKVLGIQHALILYGNPRMGCRDHYADDKISLMGRRCHYFMDWDRRSLLALRAQTGEKGEQLITLDRLADWGFAPPDSPAAERARLRAQARRAAEEQERARKAKEEAERARAEAERVTAARRVCREAEVKPSDIRSFIVYALGLKKWLPQLSSAEWCREKLGMEDPVLISFEERRYLLRKQALRGESECVYSAVICEAEGESYFVKRMRASEFEHFVQLMRQMEGRSE